MRPIKLKLQAFGPYAGTLALNMDDLGETGIYAITGETGAGKTTIFDAIVYALYGSGSGEDRSDGRSLRAVAADDDTPTKVELDFVSGGGIYHIERSPARMIPGNKSETPSKQSLKMPSGKVYTRVKEISERIEKDILGVTRDQFCQIVMIAQGEFRKLLTADTNTRREIFRNIFRTERFRELTLRLAQRSKEKYGELCDSRKSAFFALNALEADADGPLSDALNRFRGGDGILMDIDGAAALAAQLVELDGEAYRAAAEALKAAGTARDAARIALEGARRQAEEERKLKDLQSTLEAQSKRLAEAGKNRDAAEARSPELDSLSAAITIETSLLPKYAGLDSQAARKKSLEGDIRSAENALAAARRESKALQDRQGELFVERERLKDAPERRHEFSEKLNAARALGDRLNDLDRRVKARDSADQALKTARAASENAERGELAADEALKRTRAELEQLGNTALELSRREAEDSRLAEREKTLTEISALYDKYIKAGKACAREEKAFLALQETYDLRSGEARRLQLRYNANIAGILAKDLAEGAPCPVCGSVHHPSPSKLTAEAVSAEAVEAAKEAAEAAGKAATGQAGVCADRGAKRDSLRDQLVERLPDVDEGDWADAIRRRQDENAAARRESARQIKAAREADARRKRLQESEVPKAEKDRDTATAAKNRANNARAAAESNYSAAAGEVEKAASIMPPDWTPLDLSDALSENARLQRTLDGSVKQAQRDIERLNAIGQEVEGLQKRQEEQAGIIQREKEAISGLTANLENCVKALETLKAELPYPARIDCERAIRQKEAQKKALEKSIEDARDAVNRLTREIANTEGQIKPLAEALKDAPPANAEAAQAAFDESQRVWEQAVKREKALGFRKQNNETQRATLIRQAEQARKLEREYRMMSDIANTASGTGSGTKLSLETFVQGAYFDRIIRYANRRLYHMSRQQYELDRHRGEPTDRRSQTGLDLDVIDHYNGTSRAVNTLSGGEGFLASLSLALGMSDAIQASAASAVQLDAMFVDEGFGSLSESFLGLVMDELNDTAAAGHRLIGVISHVEDVKEGISRRIEVTKSPTGVSTAVIR